MHEPMVAARGAFSLEYSLLDDNHQAVLAIDEGEGSANALIFHLTNRSHVDFEWLPAPDGKPLREFHYLQLTFRPGVLSTTTLNKRAKPDDARQLQARMTPKTRQSRAKTFTRTDRVPCCLSHEIRRHRSCPQARLLR